MFEIDKLKGKTFYSKFLKNIFTIINSEIVGSVSLFKTQNVFILPLTYEQEIVQAKLFSIN